MSTSRDEKRGISRRQFIVSSAAGGLLLGFSLPLVSRVARAANGASTAPSAATVNAWIRIGSDERIVTIKGVGYKFEP